MLIWPVALQRMVQQFLVQGVVVQQLVGGEFSVCS